MNQSKFIVLEGIDGSGKSSQIELLKEAMRNRNVECCFTKEPSEGLIGKLIKSDYLSQSSMSDYRIIQTLFAADRLEHVDNEIEKYMAFHLPVICDRYVTSSLAYDSYHYLEDEKDFEEYKESIQWCMQLNHMDTLPVPDLLIYISVPIDVAYMRMESNRENKEVYERYDDLKLISQSFQYIINVLKKEPYNWNIQIVDGAESEDELHYQILDLVLRELGCDDQ